MVKSDRRQLAADMAGMVYRTFRCTGTKCDKSVVMPETTIPLGCGTPGCRGELTPRKVVPIGRLLSLLGFPPETRLGRSRSALKQQNQGSGGNFSPRTPEGGLGDQPTNSTPLRRLQHG